MIIFRRLFFSVKTWCCIFIFCLSCSSCLTQRRSKYEWRWAVAHPVAAIKVNQLNKKCYVVYHTPGLKTELDSFANGGKLDAFRHAFFMATFAQKIKPGKLTKLGIAHEKGNYRNFLKSKKEEGELADSLSTVMDLRNNDLGIRLGRENKCVSLDSLKNIVINNVKSGKALIMKRRKNGMYEECNGNRIDLFSFRNKWFIPKCLVNSDYVYP